LYKSAIFNVYPLFLETPKKALIHYTKPKFSPQKALVHCTKPKFSPEKALVNCTKPNIFLQKKKCFFATRKDVESYSQENAYLALEFSNSDPRTVKMAHFSDKV
jgi:hypothetical protein